MNSYKQFEPKELKNMSKISECKENIQCDVIVVSARKMFNYLFNKCKNEQLDIFGLSKNCSRKCYIYLNNYCIMLDTVFRMLYLFGEHYDKLRRKFKAKEIIIVDDLNVCEVNDEVDDEVEADDEAEVNDDYTSLIKPDEEIILTETKNEKRDETNEVIIDRLLSDIKEKKENDNSSSSSAIYSTPSPAISTSSSIKHKPTSTITKNPKIVSEHICPKKWMMYDYLLRGFYSDDNIYKQMMWKLKSLRKFLDEDELEDYDCWEVLLSKKFPDLYDFCLHNVRYKLHNYYAKNRVLKQFVYLITLTQLQLTQYEIWVCWKFVLRNIRKNGFSIYECENGMFDYNIVHMFRNRRTLFITDKYVITENIFFFDYKVLYYPYLLHANMFRLYWIPFESKDDPNVEAKLIKRTRFKKEFTTLLDLFDVCEKECNGKIMDANSAYTYSVFNNMKELYVDKKFGELMPDKIEETEYSWVLKESYVGLVNEWAKAFNKISKIKIVI